MSLASAGPVSFFSGLFSHASDPADTASTSAPKPKAAAAKPTQTASVVAARPKPASQAAVPAQAPAQTEVKSANAAATKPAAPQQPAALTPQQPAPAPAVETASNNNPSLLRGAQATVPAGSFDSRWGAMR
jgi:outer membrane biosynthesis protein TonB